MEQRSPEGAASTYTRLVASGQYCTAAAMQPQAIAELRAGPAGLGEAAAINYQAKIRAMYESGWGGEALHHEIHRPQ